jgi:hypothetical protein
MVAFALGWIVNDVPLSVSSKIDRFAGFYRQSSYATHLIAIQDAAVSSPRRLLRIAAQMR